MRIITIVSAALAAVLAAVLLAGCAVPAENTANSPAAAEAQPSGGPAESSPEASGGLTADEITLRIKILSKQCYGSGVGCNVEYEIEAGWPDTIGDASYQVTYEVRGPETGPEIGNLTIVSDTEYEQSGSTLTMTSSSRVKLKAKVLEVEKLP